MSFNPISSLVRNPLLSGIARDSLLAMPPETAHHATLMALKLGLAPAPARPDQPELATTIAGLPITNPIGMAAGFDKDGEVPMALARMGFGMVEVGTVTPLPQPGNEQPRIFRLRDVDAVINRMGFNNKGHDALFKRLDGLYCPAVLGVNIGANKTSSDFVADYVAGVKRFTGMADYLAVNISSPNTPGLRDLQTDEALKRLLGEVLAERARSQIHVPVFLKLAPDLDQAQMDAIAKVIGETDLDGLIISNTTITRDVVKGLEHAEETGGLSGRPIFEMATQRLAQMRQRVGKSMPIIGVGGIDSAKTAIAKIEAGADAIQIYTGMVYGGLNLLDDMKAGIANAVKAKGFSTLPELSGTAVDDWAEGRAALE